MKKTALISILLIGMLLFTACSPSSFEDADPADYLTLGNYKGLTYQAQRVEITDYMREVALNNLLAEAGYCEEHYDTITEGKVQLGDTVNIDFKGTLNGIAFDGGTATGYSLTIGSASFIDGFEEGLIGVEIGDTVKLDLTFPISYSNAELAGEDVVFEVRVNSVTIRRKYTALTDEIANEINGEIETTEELLKQIDEGLKSAAQESAASSKVDTLWNTVVDTTQFHGELPDSLLAIYEDMFDKSMLASATQAGYTDLQAAIDSGAISQEDYDAGRAAYAESQTKTMLVAYAIAKAEGYTVTEEIYNAKAAEYASTNGYQNASSFINSIGEEIVRNNIVLEFASNTVLKYAIAK